MKQLMEDRYSFGSTTSLEVELLDVTGDLGTRHLGVKSYATLADVAGESNWKIQSGGSGRFLEVYATIAAVSPPTLLPDADRVLWRKEQTEYKDSFSSAMT